MIIIDDDLMMLERTDKNLGAIELCFHYVILQICQVRTVMESQKWQALDVFLINGVVISISSAQEWTKGKK